MQTSIMEKNIATVHGLINAVINERRLDMCDRYLAANRVDHTDYGLPPGAADGHDGFQRVLGSFSEAFPDLRLKIDFTVADGDRVVAHITTTGAHRSPFMGMAPTGKSFKANGVDIFRFDVEGKIAVHWGVFDTFGMLAQLGLVPSPGTTSWQGHVGADSLQKYVVNSLAHTDQTKVGLNTLTT